MATMRDDEENVFEVSVDKEASVYSQEGKLNLKGNAAVKIYIDEKAAISKSGNAYIAKHLKMRLMDFKAQ